MADAGLIIYCPIGKKIRYIFDGKNAKPMYRTEHMTLQTCLCSKSCYSNCIRALISFWIYSSIPFRASPVHRAFTPVPQNRFYRHLWMPHFGNGIIFSSQWNWFFKKIIYLKRKKKTKTPHRFWSTGWQGVLDYLALGTLSLSFFYGSLIYLYTYTNTHIFTEQ